MAGSWWTGYGAPRLEPRKNDVNLPKPWTSRLTSIIIDAYNCYMIKMHILKAIFYKESVYER